MSETAKKMEILTVVGARPQFVKAGVVSRALRESGVRELLVHTGQHYDRSMSDVFFTDLDLPEPSHHLGVGSAPHGEQTARMLEALEKVLMQASPSCVLIYGDTNSTLAAALAAAKLHIPVAHVEAGLRSFNRRMPEEINRIVADHLSEILFAPTQTAVDNLHREGIGAARIHNVGDVMYDAALLFVRGAEGRTGLLDSMALQSGGYILATIHRAENTDDRSRLEAIIQGLGRIAGDLPVLLPLHPRTRGALDAAGISLTDFEGLRVVDPLGYVEMAHLERHAALVVTDSGGVQKEAYFHGKLCVTLRDETEWVELVSAGWNHLVPPDSTDAVETGIRKALGTPVPTETTALYGDGDAAQRIVAILANRFA